MSRERYMQAHACMCCRILRSHAGICICIQVMTCSWFPRWYALRNRGDCMYTDNPPPNGTNLHVYNYNYRLKIMPACSGTYIRPWPYFFVRPFCLYFLPNLLFIIPILLLMIMHMVAWNKWQFRQCMPVRTYNYRFLRHNMWQPVQSIVAALYIE